MTWLAWYGWARFAAAWVSILFFRAFTCDSRLLFTNLLDLLFRKTSFTDAFTFLFISGASICCCSTSFFLLSCCRQLNASKDLGAFQLLLVGLEEFFPWLFFYWWG